ncbi:MAG: TlpA disulfide reductase family protein [Bacteroidota bacterium]|nr:TlpA disulfide reductase family protein [Bacteroidota bacterium]
MNNRLLILLILLLTFKVSFGQINYYKLSNDPLRNEMSVRFVVDSVVKILPKGYTLKPIIYHRLIKKDSIINYVSLVANKTVDSKITKDKIEFVFEQDSLFLLLDKKLPDFILKDLNGKSFSSTGLLGKPTMLNFWAKYCAPCVAEIPQLNKLKEKYGEKFNFIAISDSTFQDGDIRKFLNVKPFNFYQLLEGDDYKKVLKITSLPRNIFVDKDGYVRDIQAGLPCEIDSKTGKLIVKSNEVFVKILDELQ